MGQLIMMPRRDAETTATENPQDCSATASGGTVVEMNTPEENAANSDVSGIDFSIWLNSPKERTLAYFPTYSVVAKAMQTAMRSWVREWFNNNVDVLQRPHTAYPILVFQCTHPFSGRPTNHFTYDIQQTEMLNRAFASAASKLGRDLKELDTTNLRWFTREHYFAYRSKEVVKYVQKNRRALYKMLNVETMLMNAVLKFAVIDIPKLGLEEAILYLRRAFATQLGRFSTEMNFSVRAEELLRIATDALRTKLANANVLQMPAPVEDSEELPLAA